MKILKDLLKMKNPLINTEYIPDSDFKSDLLLVNNHLTNFINSEFGDLLLSDRILYNNEIDTSVVDTLITSLFYLNAENYSRQYQIVKSVYVPTDNFAKNSTITTEHTGTETDTNIKSGSEQSEYINGTITNTNGAVEHTTTVKETVVDKSLVDKGKSIDNTGQQINTTERGNDTRTTTYNNLTDSNEKSFTDRKDIVTEQTTGNVGVTTATAMLTEHNVFWNNFNFWLLIINDILKVLTKGVWNYEQ